MTTINSAVSICRHCQHYRLEGRRGGFCQQLSAPVQGRWKACQLAVPAFAPSWEGIAEPSLWTEDDIQSDVGIVSNYSLECLENCMRSELSSTPEPDELMLRKSVSQKAS